MYSVDFSYLDLNDVDENMVVTAFVNFGSMPYRRCEQAMKAARESMQPIIDRVVEKGGIFYLCPTHDTALVQGISFSKKVLHEQEIPNNEITNTNSQEKINKNTDSYDDAMKVIK